MDIVGIGITTTIIGMLIVFSVLCIIALILYLMQYISSEKEPPGGSSENNEGAAATASIETPSVDKSNADIIAVITAAIAAAMNTSEDRLIVRSLRKTSPWINAARSEQV